MLHNTHIRGLKLGHSSKIAEKVSCCRALFKWGSLLFKLQAKSCLRKKRKKKDVRWRRTHTVSYKSLATWVFYLDAHEFLFPLTLLILTVLFDPRKNKKGYPSFFSAFELSFTDTQKEKKKEAVILTAVFIDTTTISDIWNRIRE